MQENEYELYDKIYCAKGVTMTVRAFRVKKYLDTLFFVIKKIGERQNE